MFGTLGGPELVLILVLALIVFGPRKLPDIGRSMGKMLAEFRNASNEFKRTIEEEVDAEKLKVKSAVLAKQAAAASESPFVPAEEAAPAPPTGPGDEAPSAEGAPGPVPVGAADTVSRADETAAPPWQKTPAIEPK